MSFAALKWAVHEVRGLSHVEKVLLLILSEYSDDRECAWPSQETLAEAVETSLSTLRRSLRRLEALGLISSTRRWVMDERGDTHRATNVYQLHVGAVPDWEAVGGRRRGPDRGGAGKTAGTEVPSSGGGGGGAAGGRHAHTGQSDRHERPGTEVPVDNLSDLGVSVGGADTGQSDRYGGATRPYRSERGGIPVTRVTAISTPTLQENLQTGPDRTEVAGGALEPGSVRSGPGVGSSSYAAGRTAGAAAPGADPGGGNAPGNSSGAPGAAERAPGVPGDGSGPEIASDRLSRLLGECLPESMRVMDAAGARAVGGLLAERLAAGWRPGQIRAAMGGRLPEDVGRMSALVAARLRINVDPALAPDGGSASSAGAVGGVEGAASARAAEDALWEARRRRSEELAGTARRDEGPPGEDPGGEDPLWARARAEAQRSLPAGAGPMALARAAAGLMARWLADPAGAAV